MFSFFMFFFCLFMIFLYSSHYVSILLFFELVLLSVFLFLVTFYFLGFGLTGCFFFLLVIVCMGGFSVSLLVGVSRSYGRDFWGLLFVF